MTELVPTTLFRGVRVFDGRSPALSGATDVLVSGHLIASVGNVPDPLPEESRTIVEGRGRVLMPGLIDTRTPTSPSPRSARRQDP